MRDHLVRDAWTDIFSYSNVTFQLLDGQPLLRVLLVLLLQLQKKLNNKNHFWKSFFKFYFSSLLSGYHKTLQQKSAQKPKINGRITTYSLIPKTVSETKGWVYWCLGDLCIPTSVKTGEMTVVRLADLLIWSWTQGWRGQENKRLWESKLYWPPTSSYCIKKKKKIQPSTSKV